MHWTRLAFFIQHALCVYFLREVKVMRLRLLAVVILLSFLVSGCTQFTGYQASSHLAYPNGNVTPIGYATASETKCRFLMPVYLEADMQENTFNKAIQSRGGDLLIDHADFLTTWFIPLLYFNIYCAKYTVEGTVAKQEIGKQKLN